MSQAPCKPETRRGVFTMWKPRFIHSPAPSSIRMAAPRFSHPICFRYLSRSRYAWSYIAPPQESSRRLGNLPEPGDPRFALRGFLVSLVDPSKLVPPSYLPLDATHQRSTQVRLVRISRTRIFIALFDFHPRATLPAAAARALVTLFAAFWFFHGHHPSLT